jgi:hypothetical protein
MGPGPRRVRRWLFPRRLHAKTPAVIVILSRYAMRAYPTRRTAYLQLLFPHAPAAAATAHGTSNPSDLATVSCLPRPMFLSTNRRLPLYLAASLQHLASLLR